MRFTKELDICNLPKFDQHVITMTSAPAGKVHTFGGKLKPLKSSTVETLHVV